VQKKWESTFTLRRKEILDKTNNTADIVKSWPLYRHSDGFSLVTNRVVFFNEKYQKMVLFCRLNWTSLSYIKKKAITCYEIGTSSKL
jgi:hypothetical protein